MVRGASAGTDAAFALVDEMTEEDLLDALGLAWSSLSNAEREAYPERLAVPEPGRGVSRGHLVLIR